MTDPRCPRCQSRTLRDRGTDYCLLCGEVVTPIARPSDADLKRERDAGKRDDRPQPAEFAAAAVPCGPCHGSGRFRKEATIAKYGTAICVFCGGSGLTGVA